MRSLSFSVCLSALFLHAVAGRDIGRHFRRAPNDTTASAGLTTAGTEGPFIVPWTGWNGSSTTYTYTGECAKSWLTWLSNSMDLMDLGYSTWMSTYTYHNITASVTTLCDGHPRIVGGRDALTTVATGSGTTITSAMRNFTVPSPTCMIPASECTGTLDYYTSYESYSLCSGGPNKKCGPCTIQGGTVNTAEG